MFPAFDAEPTLRMYGLSSADDSMLFSMCALNCVSEITVGASLDRHSPPEGPIRSQRVALEEA
jgi:hypothetical protein